jgi:lipopolysaccharide transport system permease protein
VIENLRELYHYRGLLYMITYRDIRVRYKQSIMGLMWAVLMPVLIIMAGIVVRYAYSLAAHTPVRTADVASVAVRSLPWTFLVSSIRFGCNSLILSNQNLVTKIYFPREIFPLAAVLSSLFDFVIASGPLVIFLMIVHVHWSVYVAWVPALLLILIAIAAGVGFIVATASLFFRDVKYIVEVLLTFGIFFTPVFFDVHMFGDKGKWLMLNPVAPLLEGLAGSITAQQPPDLRWVAYSLSWAVFSLLGGYMFFKHLEPAFAESI